MIDEIDILDPVEIEDAPAESLAIDEQQTLAQCEAVIARGVQTFIEVGEALATIRDGKLYRADFTTFEHYCRNKWGIGDSRARQLIGAANVAREIETVTTVTVANERQARELMKLTPDQRLAAANRAAEIAGDTAPAAKHFQQAAAEISAPAPDMADIFKRLSAHGYDRGGEPRQKGMTTFHTFRDRASDLDEDSAGVIELAEGELPIWLQELDSNAAYAQAKQERYLAAKARAEALGYSLTRDGGYFALSPAGQGMPAMRGTLDQLTKVLDGYAKNAAKKAAATPDLPDSDTQHMETITAILKEAEDKGERTGTRLYREAYDHAREIHDVALYNKAIALIDRATDTPIAPKPAPDVPPTTIERLPAVPSRPKRPVSADASAVIVYLRQMETYASALESVIMVLQKQIG